MAYPTVSAPYGLQPINRIDGMPYAFEEHEALGYQVLF